MLLPKAKPVITLKAACAPSNSMARSATTTFRECQKPQRRMREKLHPLQRSRTQVQCRFESCLTCYLLRKQVSGGIGNALCVSQILVAVFLKALQRRQSKMDEKTEALKTKIRAQFSDVRQPSKASITVCDCWECLALRDTFAGLDWKTVAPEVMEQNHHLSLFSAEAFHYFLPAYLLHSLSCFSVGSDFLSTTAYSLTPGKEEPGQAEYWKDKFRFFTDEQIDSIFEFLDLVRESAEMYRLHVYIDRGKKRLLNYLKR